MMAKFYLIFIVALVIHQARSLPQPEKSLKAEADDVVNKAKQNAKEFTNDLESNVKSKINDLSDEYNTQQQKIEEYAQKNADKFLKEPAYGYNFYPKDLSKGLGENKLIQLRSLPEEDLDESEDGPAIEPRSLGEEETADGYVVFEEIPSKQPRSLNEELDENEDVENQNLEPRSIYVIEETPYEEEPEN